MQELKWIYIQDIQPEHDEIIIQCDRDYEGYYSIGIRQYNQKCTWKEVLDYYLESGLGIPEFYWISYKDFPFPNFRITHWMPLPKESEVPFNNKNLHICISKDNDEIVCKENCSGNLDLWIPIPDYDHKNSYNVIPCQFCPFCGYKPEE